jgi:hypothetical protein
MNAALKYMPVFFFFFFKKNALEFIMMQECNVLFTSA